MLHVLVAPTFTTSHQGELRILFIQELTALMALNTLLNMVFNLRFCLSAQDNSTTYFSK